MTTDSTERATDDESPSLGDDFMDFVGALVRTHHRLPNDGDVRTDRRQSKAALRAPRHERARSESRGNEDAS